jgi:hypothetical protein
VIRTLSCTPKQHLDYANQTLKSLAECFIHTIGAEHSRRCRVLGWVIILALPLFSRENSMRYQVGETVKYSESVLRTKRDHMLAAGSYEQKSIRKKWLDDAAAVRGTVLRLYNNGYADCVDVQVGESIHKSMLHIWEKA